MKRPFFNGLIVLALTLLGAGDLHAIDWGEAARHFQQRIGEIVLDGYPATPDVRIEEVRSRGSDPILTGNCQRYVHSGGFWGDSAVDWCCDENRLCRFRLPFQEESDAEWHEIDLRAGRNLPGCSTFMLETIETAPPLSSWLLDLLVDKAFADYNIGLGQNHWSPNQTEEAAADRQGTEKIRISNTMNEVAGAIQIAIANNRSDDVGPENSVFREYSRYAFFAARYLAHALGPVGFPDCPQEIRELCQMIHGSTAENIHYYPLWYAGRGEGETGGGGQGSQGTAGAVPPDLGVSTHLNVFGVNRRFEFGVDAHSTAKGVAATVSLHEAAHQLFYWGRGYYEPSEDAAPFNGIYPFIGTIPRVEYNTETTSRMVEAVVFFFLPQSWRSEVQAVFPDLVQNYEELLRLLREDPSGASARIVSLPSALYSTYFWDDLEENQRQWLRRHCFQNICRCADRTGSLCEQVPSCMTDGEAIAVCHDTIMQGDGAVPTLQQLESELVANGGPSLFVSREGPPQGSTHASIHHDYVASPNTLAGPGSVTIGDVPDDSDWEPTSYEGADPNEPGYTPPATEVPVCVPAYEYYRSQRGYSPEQVPVTSGCFQWCWQHFPNADVWPCTLLQTDDVEGGCVLSGNYSSCQAARGDRVEECNRSENRLSEFCRDECERSNGAHDFCRYVCAEDNGAHDYCDDICRSRVSQGAWSGFCDTLCAQNLEQDFCIDGCERDWSRNYCDEICADRPGLSFCRQICSGNGNQNALTYPFCEEICMDQAWDDDGGYDGFCGYICQQELQTHESCFVYCQQRDTCSGWCLTLCDSGNRGNFCNRCAPPEPPADEDDCPGGWVRERGAIEMVSGGCYPFLGTICCDPNSGRHRWERDCRPIGSNHACDEGGWCGCRADGSGRNFDQCISPHTPDWDADYHDGHDFFVGAQYCYLSSGDCVCIPQSYGSAEFVYCNDPNDRRYDGDSCCGDLSGVCVDRDDILNP